MTGRRHSRFGASAAKRYFACPGSVALCDKVPASPDTPESIEGTAAHRLIDRCLRNGFDPEEMTGRFLEYTRGNHADRFEVEPEMAEAVTRFVEDVRADIKEGAQVFVEYTFFLGDIDMECWGTCDAVSYFPETGLLKVRDYKHGAGVYVPAVDNKQLQYYGLGAMLALGERVNDAELWVYQPRWTADPEPRRWDVSGVELLAFGKELEKALAAARAPDAPLVPGDHCQFCPARGACPALFDVALTATGSDLIPYAGPIMEPKPVDYLTPFEIGRRLKFSGLVRTWLNGLEAYAFGEAMRGHVPDGFKIVKAATKRRFKDAELAARQAPRVFPGVVTEDAMWTRKIISPKALEDKVGKKAAAGFLAEYAERPEGFSLVPVDDKRKAVPVGPSAEFTPIGDLKNG